MDAPVQSLATAVALLAGARAAVSCVALGRSAPLSHRVLSVFMSISMAVAMLAPIDATLRLLLAFTLVAAAMCSSIGLRRGHGALHGAHRGVAAIVMAMMLLFAHSPEAGEHVVASSPHSAHDVLTSAAAAAAVLLVAAWGLAVRTEHGDDLARLDGHRRAESRSMSIAVATMWLAHL